MSCLATSTSEKLLLDAVLVLQLCCGLEATYLSTYSLEAGYRVVVHTTSRGKELKQITPAPSLQL